MAQNRKLCTEKDRWVIIRWLKRCEVSVLACHFCGGQALGRRELYQSGTTIWWGRRWCETVVDIMLIVSSEDTPVGDIDVSYLNTSWKWPTIDSVSCPHDDRSLCTEGHLHGCWLMLMRVGEEGVVKLLFDSDHQSLTKSHSKIHTWFAARREISQSNPTQCRIPAKLKSSKCITFEFLRLIAVVSFPLTCVSHFKLKSPIMGDLDFKLLTNINNDAR